MSNRGEHKHSERAGFLRFVKQYSLTTISALSANLEDFNRGEDVVVSIGAKSFLRFVSDRTILGTFRPISPKGTTEAFRLTCAIIKELLSHFGKLQSVPYSSGPDSKQPLYKNISTFPEKWRIYLWLVAQLEVNHIPLSSLPAKWLVEQYGLEVGVSADAIRKIKERAFVRLSCQTGKRGIPALLARETQEEGTAINLSANLASADCNECIVAYSSSMYAVLEQCSVSDLANAALLIEDIQHGLKCSSGAEVIGALEQKLKADRISKCEVVKKRLYHRLAKHGEKFMANGAWLYHFEPSNDMLHADVSHNSDLTAARGGLKNSLLSGVIGRVASTNQPYVSGDVANDSQYVSSHFGTQSALAVPLPCAQPNKPLGVLSFESHNRNWFCDSDLIRLQSLMLELVPDLIVYSALKTPNYFLGSWHYRTDEWAIDHMLSTYCDFIQETLQSECGIKAAVIVWEHDVGKDLFWVRGTSGYDHEYATVRGLPIKSFVGNVFLGKKPIVTSLDAAIKMDYQRPLKAKELNVTWLAACPLWTDSDPEMPWGVLAVYGFRANEQITQELLLALSGHLSDSISYWETTRRAAAKAFTEMKLSRATGRESAKYEVARDVVKELLAADGVSIFMPKANNMLSCIVTTGLEDEFGNPVSDLNSASYNLEKETGATVSLWKYPETVLRKVDAADDHEAIKEIGMPTSIGFRNKFRETASRSPMERRRFIGLAVKSTDGNGLVVRAVRQSGSRPFRQADGKLLREIMTPLIASICAGIMESPRDTQRFSVAYEAQLDISLGAMLQEALKKRGGNGAFAVQLSTKRKTGKSECETSEIFFDSLASRFKIESPRWEPLPDLIAKKWNFEGGEDLCPLTIEEGSSDKRIVAVPFLVTYERKSVPFIIKAFYSTPLIEAAEVESWVSVAQALSVVVGIACLKPAERARVFGFERGQAERGKRDGSQSEINAAEANTASRAIYFGPSLLKSGIAERRRIDWFRSLIQYLDAGPSFRCVAKTDGSTVVRWGISGLQDDWEANLKKREAALRANK